MILYHAITTYHLLKFAVHKLRNHPNEEAVILIPNYLPHKPKELYNRGSIFSKVVEFGWERKKAPYLDIFKDINYELKHSLGDNYRNKITEYNIARAEYFFGSWAVENGILFQWFEDGDGRFTQPEPIMKDDERVNPVRFQLAMNNKLYNGENENVIKRFIKFSSQIGEFSKDNTVDFDIVKEISLLSYNDKDMLLDFFGVPKDLVLQKDSCLMLTQHFSNIRLLSYQEQALCYQLTADYYMDGYHTYYKWHPSDVTPYPSFMENISMISGNFPVELLCLVLKSRFKVGASINSTGILNLSPICDKILTFNQDYINTFWYNHQYYFAIKLLELLSYKLACAINVNYIQMNNICNFALDYDSVKVVYGSTLADAEKMEEYNVYIIGDISEHNSSIIEFCDKHKNSTIIFLAFKEKSIFKLFKDNPLFLVKEIKLYDSTHNELSILDCFSIGILVPNKEIYERVQLMKYVKVLKNTGAITVVEQLSDKDIQIAILKGMLKATEEQLYRCTKELEKYKLN